jgi:tetratricopeptide (TPR) repeat protein
MLCRCRKWGTVLGLSGALLVGCHSPEARKSASPKASAAPVSWPVGGKPPTEADSDRLAKAHAHYAAGVVHDLNGQTEAALEQYYQAAFSDPADEWLILEVSRRFLVLKQSEKALELLSRAAAQPEASGGIYARLGVVYSQLGKPEQAVTAFRTAIRKSPRSLVGYQNLFVSHLQNRHEEEALKVLDQAAHQSGVDAEFLVGLSELYLNLFVQAPSLKERASAEALKVLDRAAKLNPESPELQLRLADNLGSMGEPEKAAQIYLALLRSLPDVPTIKERIHAKLASIYLRSSNPQRAAEQLEAMLREDPTNPQPYFYLGYLAYGNKKPAEAAEFFGKAVLLNPDFEDAYYQLALSQLGQDKPDEALATLAQARKKFRPSFLLELWTGLAYARKKDYTTAIEHFNAAEVVAKASESTRLNEEFYFQLGSAHERKGDLEQAEKYFLKCLELAPDFSEAQNYLGYMWAEKGMKLEEARELIEKAVKAEPKNAAYLDSLGWVYFKLGKHEQALEQVLKAVEFSSEPDATLYDHLGDIYAALNQHDKAREAWEKSLEVEQNDQVKQKLAGARKP